MSSPLPKLPVELATRIVERRLPASRVSAAAIETLAAAVIAADRARSQMRVVIRPRLVEVPVRDMRLKRAIDRVTKAREALRHALYGRFERAARAELDAAIAALAAADRAARTTIPATRPAQPGPFEELPYVRIDRP
jgi:hypothetical protein